MDWAKGLGLSLRGIALNRQLPYCTQFGRGRAGI